MWGGEAVKEHVGGVGWHVQERIASHPAMRADLRRAHEIAPHEQGEGTHKARGERSIRSKNSALVIKEAWER
jgi:hypothetical protein